VVDAVRGWIDIGAPRLRDSQKYRNICRDPRVTLILDDDSGYLQGSDSSNVRRVEIRGMAEPSERAASAMTTDVIRIRPRIDAWNLVGGVQDNRLVTY